jgi:8-oxo-dGTP diphosphatase
MECGMQVDEVAVVQKEIAFDACRPMDVASARRAGVKHRATILCRRGDEVLLVRKPHAKWSLPGGKIEKEESPYEAAVRELAEETGLDAQRARYVTSLEWKNTLHYLFEVDVHDDRSPCAANEIEACKWMAVEKLNKRSVRGSARKLLAG